jgi:hypothetical protein
MNAKPPARGGRSVPKPTTGLEPVTPSLRAALRASEPVLASRRDRRSPCKARGSADWTCLECTCPNWGFGPHPDPADPSIAVCARAIRRRDAGDEAVFLGAMPMTLSRRRKRMVRGDCSRAKRGKLRAARVTAMVAGCTLDVPSRLPGRRVSARTAGSCPAPGEAIGRWETAGSREPRRPLEEIARTSASSERLGVASGRREGPRSGPRSRFRDQLPLRERRAPSLPAPMPF